MTVKNKLKLLKFLGLRFKKEYIPKKDSIRPMGVKSIYPEGWKEPYKRVLTTGEEEWINPNGKQTGKALEQLKKDLVK